ncbi:MAG: MerR family transcriptional regulator [Defluviitaleaceae bacterium]|nr:MerR family transcriptional regulator [Defluviitaleaceae bacterium]
MNYTVNKLAKMSGVSNRTLRYYDQIGLLKPGRISSNGYRIYEKTEVDALQEILFYRELGVSLDEIKKMITATDYDRNQSLNRHLTALEQKKEQINLLIINVTKTISSTKGEIIMGDKEKFEGFKQNLIDENENKYGCEIRKKYGDETVDNSNAKIKNMTEEQAVEIDRLTNELNLSLKEAVLQGNPANELAQKACELHRRWLCFFWSDGQYSKETHKNIAQMYCDDERFKAYYDDIIPGCAEFLRDSINIYCG